MVEPVTQQQPKKISSRAVVAIVALISFAVVLVTAIIVSGGVLGQPTKLITAECDIAVKDAQILELRSEAERLRSDL